VVVAVILMGSMKPTVDQVIDVIAVRYGLMSAALAVFVRRVAPDRSCVAARMRRINGDHVLVDVIVVRMMQVAVMQVIDVIIVSHRGVAALWPVGVLVGAFMDLVGHAPTIRRRARFLKGLGASSVCGAALVRAVAGEDEVGRAGLARVG
jgi:hypothetical protein